MNSKLCKVAKKELRNFSSNLNYAFLHLPSLCGLLYDTVSASIWRVIAECEMNWKGFGRERSWYLFEIISQHLPGGTNISAM
jgi:hypothetical protein